MAVDDAIAYDQAARLMQSGGLHRRPQELAEVDAGQPDCGGAQAFARPGGH